MNESNIKQTPTSIIQTFINGDWKSTIIQTIDNDGEIHIVREITNGEELKEKTEVIV